MTKFIGVPPGTGLMMGLGKDGKLHTGNLEGLVLKNKPGTVEGCDCNFECNCVAPVSKAANHPNHGEPKEPKEPKGNYSDLERLFWFESENRVQMFGVVPKKFFEEHNHMDDTFDLEMHDVFAAIDIAEAMENIFEVPERFLVGKDPNYEGDPNAEDWGIDHRTIGDKDKLIEFLEGLPLNLKYSKECQELFKN